MRIQPESQVSSIFSEGHQAKGHEYDHNQKNSSEKNVKLMTPEGKFRFYPVGPVDRLQKTVDCPHGKINSEHEAEQKQRSVF